MLRPGATAPPPLVTHVTGLTSLGFRDGEDVLARPIGRARDSDRSALTLDGRELFVPYRGGLVRSSAVDGRILDRQLPPVTPNRLHLSPDGRLLIVVGFATATGYPAIGVVEVR